MKDIYNKLRVLRLKYSTSIKKILQRAFLVFIGILLALVILEIGLRISGFVLISAQGDEFFEEEAYRILTIGESTTTLSWAQILENELNDNDKGIKFQVFCQGIPGTNTAFIISRLSDNLDKYSPDMVVSMMGVNDHDLNFIYKPDMLTEVRLFFSDFRVYKLFMLLREAYFGEALSEDYICNEKMNDIVVYTTSGDYEKAEIMLKELIESNPLCGKAHITLAYIYHSQGRHELARKVIRNFLKIENYGDDYSYTCILKSHFEGYIDDDKIDDYLNENNFIVSLESNRDITKYHYDMFYDSLSKRNISYIAMQYPTLSTDVVESFLEGRNVPIVSNELNFKEAVEEEGYTSIFSDEFGKDANPIFRGNYGHTTEKGDRLIVENLKKEILSQLNITS